MENVERAKVRIDRFRPLEMKHHRHHPRGHRRTDIASRTAYPHAAFRGSLDPQQQRNHREDIRQSLGLLHHRRHRHVVLHPFHPASRRPSAFPRRNEHREKSAAEAARHHPRQIEVPMRAAVDERADRIEGAHPQAKQRIVVPVEDERKSILVHALTSPQR